MSIKDEIPTTDPFKVFATSFFQQDPGRLYKKMKELREARVTLMRESKEPLKKAPSKGKKQTTRKGKTDQEKALAGLKKILGKVKKSDLDKLALLVKAQTTLEKEKK